MRAWIAPASALYEPGSVFKIVTLSAAIDQGITNPDEVVDCQNGAIYIAGHRIRDHKAYGMLTVSQILANSSDVGAIKIGLRLGAPKFYDYIRAFGFGQPTGVDLPGESRGKLRRLENWTPVSVGSISMGQEVGVTPLQMITAVSAMANGGLIVRPHVVRELRHGNAGDRSRRSREPRRVIQGNDGGVHARACSKAWCWTARARRRKLDGYTSAGKTGTAQKYDPETGRYSTQIDRIVRGLCADQYSCGHDSRATRFAGRRARRRPGRRAGVQARRAAGARVPGCAARRSCFRGNTPGEPRAGRT